MVQVDAETPVAIYAEGKEHAMAIGYTKMSTADMKSINKGIGVSGALFTSTWSCHDCDHSMNIVLEFEHGDSICAPINLPCTCLWALPSRRDAIDATARRPLYFITA
jgi:hypothetical protein